MPDLNPPGLQPPGSQPGEDKVPGRQAVLPRIVWMLLGFVVALALVVLVMLPHWVEDKNAQQGSTPAANPAAVPPLPAGVARHDAEQALQAFLRMRAQPNLANAERWAPDAWQLAMDTAESGDAHYGKGDFSAARSNYQVATDQLITLQQSREQRLADALTLGRSALEQNDVDAALSAFDMALEIDPDNEQARLGMERSRVRNDVLLAMQDGRKAQAQGNLPAALDSYSVAVQLDSSYAPAQEARQHVAQKLDEIMFRDAMSQALASLDTGNLTAANEALSVAIRIYPDHPAIQDARQRLAEKSRQVRLARLRRDAQQLASREDWSSAVRLYKEALKIDNQAVYARTGLAHAEQRMRLHAQFDHYLSDLGRLASDEPLSNAVKLLEANQHLPDSEPLLARKVSQLKEAVQLAQTPITLRIMSDNQTDVAVYHVARFGKFSSREITLRPGRYTVTGSRPGYRDVRKVVTLKPGDSGKSITIRCEEPI